MSVGIAKKALTMQSGTAQRIADADTLRVGNGIDVSSGNLTITAGAAANIEIKSDVVESAASANKFDLSASSGLFKTTTGAVTIGPGAVTVSGAGTFTAAGTALTVTNNAAVGGTLTVTGVLNANGTVDRSTATTLSLGTATASAVSIGRAGFPTTINGDAIVSGNLTVNGTTTYLNSANALLTDRFQLNNSSYTSAAAVTSGIVFNTDPEATTFSVSSITGGNTFNLTTDPTGFIAAGDLILVTGTNNADNAGIMQVASITTSSVTISAAPNASVSGIVTTALVNDATAGGTLVKSLFSILRADSGGSSFSTGFGNAVPISFNALATTATITLQSAYEAGNTITTSAGEGDVTIAGTENLNVNGSVDLEFGTTGRMVGTAFTGPITLRTTGAMSMKGDTSAKFGDDVATWDFDGAGAVAETGMTTLTITATGAGNISFGAASTIGTTAGALNFDAATTIFSQIASTTITTHSASGFAVAAGKDLTMSGGAGAMFSLAGNDASSITTTGSSLTVTGGAASTWSTSVGLLTLEGAAGVRLNGSAATPYLKIGETANVLEIQAGKTMKATSTGVNQADIVVIRNVTTTGLANGDSGYVSSANTMTKTDADVLASSRFFGINEGTVGSMTVGGTVAAAKFTTAGGTPTPGSPVFLAPGTEEASASGKLTATAPSTTGQVVAEVGISLDDANYPGAKTALILLQPKMVVVL